MQAFNPSQLQAQHGKPIKIAVPHIAKRMSLDTLLNAPNLESSVDYTRLSKSADFPIKIAESNATQLLHHSSSKLEVHRRNSSGTGSSPTLNANRAVCEICKSEAGRCHASDPHSMQNFFKLASGFSSPLKQNDWLCMKCYSKWYNRCKRKAASLAPAEPSLVPTPRKKKNSKDVITDGALLLTNISQDWMSSSTPVHTDSSDTSNTPKITSATNPTSTSDTLSPRHEHSALIQYTPPRKRHASERGDPDTLAEYRTEMEELRREVSRNSSELLAVKNELSRLQCELALKDEKVETMLAIVRNQVIVIHNLLRPNSGDGRS